MRGVLFCDAPASQPFNFCPTLTTKKYKKTEYKIRYSKEQEVGGNTDPHFRAKKLIVHDSKKKYPIRLFSASSGWAMNYWNYIRRRRRNLCKKKLGASLHTMRANPVMKKKLHSSSVTKGNNVQQPNDSIGKDISNSKKKSECSEPNSGSDTTLKTEEQNYISKPEEAPKLKQLLTAASQTLDFQDAIRSRMDSQSSVSKDDEQTLKACETMLATKQKRSTKSPCLTLHMRDIIDISNTCAICTDMKLRYEMGIRFGLSLGSMVNLAWANPVGLCMRHQPPEECIVNPVIRNGGTATVEKNHASSMTYQAIPACLYQLGNGFWTDTQSLLKSRAVTLLSEFETFGSPLTYPRKSGLQVLHIVTSTSKLFSVGSQIKFILLPNGRHPNSQMMQTVMPQAVGLIPPRKKTRLTQEMEEYEDECIFPE